MIIVKCHYLVLSYEVRMIFVNKTNETNRKLKTLCKSKGMIFINNNNIDSTFLNRSKLHLNKSVTSLLIKNISKVVHSV